MEILISNSRSEFIKSIPHNTPKPFRLGELKFFIIRTGDRLCAFERMCPHSGYTLESAVVNHNNELVCPWHGYRYDMTSGEESGKRCRNLALFPIYEKDNGLYITIPDQTIV